MKKQCNERNYKDPVCGMEISHTTAVDDIEYQGKTYYFCASVCRQAFNAEPEKYLRDHRQRGSKK